MPKVYAFDFDGVLFDSAKESSLVALRAWKKMARPVRSISAIELQRLRPYHKNAREFYAVLCLASNKKRVTRKTVQDFTKKNSAAAKNFADIFYQERYALQKENFKKWALLHGEFPFMVSLFKQLITSSPVYIVSSKDKKTIQMLLKNSRIKFDESRILANNISFDKKDHIEIIKTREGVKENDILFIDDAIDHLINVSKTGVQVALASWGYVLPEDLREARRRGWLMLDKKNVDLLRTTDNLEEYFDVVDNNNKVIGKATRKEVHVKGLWHRAAHILIANRKGEILLQKRSMTKDLYKGYWIDGVAGHVDAGESYEQTAQREITEELGITMPFTRLFDFKKAAGNDREHVRVFGGIHEGPFKPKLDEVQYVTFFSLDEINRRLKTDKFTPGTVEIIKHLKRHPEILRKLRR